MTRRASRFAITIGAAATVAAVLGMADPAPLAAQQAAAAATPGLTYTQPLAPQALMQVQERLRQLGAYSGRVDGLWGPDSQQALERFQQSRGLQVTGQLNQATAATLDLDPAALLAARGGGGGSGAVANAAPQAAAAGGAAGAPTLSQAAVRNLQQRLRSLGFYRGGVDGIWGPGTQQALERFQQGRGLQATGQINPATAQALGLDPNNLAEPVSVR
jgi:peptidoglycan hydrolase-like protein with peptidoglycan-binding domain